MTGYHARRALAAAAALLVQFLIGLAVGACLHTVAPPAPPVMVLVTQEQYRQLLDLAQRDPVAAQQAIGVMARQQGNAAPAQ